jgi:hypothetical protein
MNSNMVNTSDSNEGGSGGNNGTISDGNSHGPDHPCYSRQTYAFAAMHIQAPPECALAFYEVTDANGIPSACEATEMLQSFGQCRATGDMCLNRFFDYIQGNVSSACGGIDPSQWSQCSQQCAQALSQLGNHMGCCASKISAFLEHLTRAEGCRLVMDPQNNHNPYSFRSPLENMFHRCSLPMPDIPDNCQPSQDDSMDPFEYAISEGKMGYGDFFVVHARLNETAMSMSSLSPDPVAANAIIAAALGIPSWNVESFGTVANGYVSIVARGSMDSSAAQGNATRLANLVNNGYQALVMALATPPNPNADHDPMGAPQLPASGYGAGIVLDTTSEAVVVPFYRPTPEPFIAETMMGYLLKDNEALQQTAQNYGVGFQRSVQGSLCNLGNNSRTVNLLLPGNAFPVAGFSNNGFAQSPGNCLVYFRTVGTDRSDTVIAALAPYNFPAFVQANFSSPVPVVNQATTHILRPHANSRLAGVRPNLIPFVNSESEPITPISGDQPEFVTLHVPNAAALPQGEHLGVAAAPILHSSAFQQSARLSVLTDSRSPMSCEVVVLTGQLPTKALVSARSTLAQVEVYGPVSITNSSSPIDYTPGGNPFNGTGIINFENGLVGTTSFQGNQDQAFMACQQGFQKPENMMEWEVPAWGVVSLDISDQSSCSAGNSMGDVTFQPASNSQQN